MPECSEHLDDLHEFEASLASQYKGQLSKWKEDVEAWEADMSKPNPFEIKSDGLLFLSIFAQLHTNPNFSQLSLKQVFAYNWSSAMLNVCLSHTIPSSTPKSLQVS